MSHYYNWLCISARWDPELKDLSEQHKIKQALVTNVFLYSLFSLRAQGRNKRIFKYHLLHGKMPCWKCHQPLSQKCLLKYQQKNYFALEIQKKTGLRWAESWASSIRDWELFFSSIFAPLWNSICLSGSPAEGVSVNWMCSSWINWWQIRSSMKQLRRREFFLRWNSRL